MLYDRIDLKKYIVVSIWFGCNNACSICMLSGLKGKLPAIGFDRYKEVLIDVADSGSFENLILSGAEVTTFADLDRYVEFAASLGWFKKIQVQTNGRRLCDKPYLDHLIACGVNEFFVSIHGLEDVHDAVTGIGGSFRETMGGLDNLEPFDVNVITNTVLTKINFYHITRLMAALLEKRISEMHLWNYFPMEQTDTGDFLVSREDFIRLLPEMLSVIRPSGRALVLKSFPECLSIGMPGFFDSWFPVTVLPDMFWRKFGESGFGTCVYRNECAAQECWGLSSAYMKKFGDERHFLSPVR
jgi:MoaA/NifB/PqqE/SkfB family radical SAM enzyme